MRDIRALIHLLRHLWRLKRAGQIRFRLETFGLYYPARPYESAAWRISPRVALLLLRSMRSYAHWLMEMDAVRRQGPHGWWLQHHYSARRQGHER